MSFVIPGVFFFRSIKYRFNSDYSFNTVAPLSLCHLLGTFILSSLNIRFRRV